MKVKKSDLKRILNELVPPQVRAASSQEIALQTKVSQEPVAGGIFFVLPTRATENMTMKFKETGTPWYEKFYEWIGTNIPYYTPFIESNEIKIPEVLEETIEADLEANVNEWAKTFLYNNKSLMSIKDAAISDNAGSINIQILGDYRFVGGDRMSADGNAHTIILSTDVDKMVDASFAFLTEPVSESDLKNVELIMGFLAGDQKSQAEIFGTNENYFSGIKQTLAQTANKYLGTEFDTSDFEKARGNRILCASGRQQTDQLYDAVEYFNNKFSEMSSLYFETLSCEYKQGYIIDTVVGTVTQATSQTDLAAQLGIYTSDFHGQILGCGKVFQAGQATKKVRVDSNEFNFLRGIKQNAKALIAIKQKFEEAKITARENGFVASSGLTSIQFTPTTLDLSESKSSNNDQLLTEELSTSDVQNILTTDWFDRIFTAQQTGGLAKLADIRGSGKMQFFLSPEHIDAPKETRDIEFTGDVSKAIADFFSSMVNDNLLKIKELTLSGPEGVIGKKLLIKDVEDFAFFIQLNDGSYLNPFDSSFGYVEGLRNSIKALLTAQQADSYEIEGRTRPVEGGEEPSAEEPTTAEVSEREGINPPNYDENVKGLVRQLERIVNAYNDSIKETDKMTVDGKWEGSEDSAWGSMVDHAMGDAGKSPAKGSGVTVTSISNDWKQAGKDLVRQGLKGYTNNAAGALAFAYDAYTNGEDVKNGHKRPLRSGGRRSGASTEPAQKTSGLPKRSVNDITVSLAEKLKDNKDAAGIVERIKSQMKMHVPESVSKEIKIVIQTRIGGAPRFQSRSDINSQLRQPDELIRFIKTTIKGPRNTKGVINIVIPKGIYTLNESTVNSLAALIQGLVKQK